MPDAWRDMADTLNGALDEIQSRLASAADRAMITALMTGASQGESAPMSATAM